MQFLQDLAIRDDDDWRSHGFGSTNTNDKQKKRLGVNFARACTKVFEFSGVSVVQDVEHKCLGAVVWDCGILMCKLLQRVTEEGHGSFLEGKTVLELGSGTGLVGIFAAKTMNPKSVVLTDLDIAVPLLTENVERNGCEEKVKVSAYEWGEESPCDLIKEGAPFDILLCSDVLYERNSYEYLLEAIKTLTKPKAVLIFTVKLRFPTDEAKFFDQLELLFKDHITIDVIPTNAIDASIEGVSIFVVRIL